MSKVKKTIRIDEETSKIIKRAVRDAKEDPDIPTAPELSESMLIGMLIKEGLESTDSDIIDVIPDATFDKWEVKNNKQERKDETYLNKLAMYWRQNVNRELTKMYDDEAPADPKRVRIEMQSWRDEIKDVSDDPDEIESKLNWLDSRIEEYEKAVEYSLMVPDKGFDRVSDQVTQGAELHAMADQGEDLLKVISDEVRGDGWDGSAIKRKISNEFEVAEETVDVLLDAAIDDGKDPETLLGDTEQYGHDDEGTGLVLADQLVDIFDTDYVGVDSRRAVDIISANVTEHRDQPTPSDSPTEQTETATTDGGSETSVVVADGDNSDETMPTTTETVDTVETKPTDRMVARAQYMRQTAEDRPTVDNAVTTLPKSRSEIKDHLLWELGATEKQCQNAIRRAIRYHSD